MITYRAEILDEVERRRLELSVGLLRVYNYYRVLVGIGLLAAASQTLFGTRFGQLDTGAFYLITRAYTLTNLLSAVALQFLPARIYRSDLPALSLVLFDILVLTTLTFFSGGVSSGIGVLVLVSAAIGYILVTGRLANLIPAWPLSPSFTPSSTSPSPSRTCTTTTSRRVFSERSTSPPPSLSSASRVGCG